MQSADRRPTEFRRILFVCLGNICRSPAAQGVFAKLAKNNGLRVELDSAGTSDWHIGAPPYGPMIKAASARGYDLEALRARQLSSRDFERFDLLVGMDSENIRNIEKKRPAGNQTPVRAFLDFAVETEFSEVPDPYYTRNFEQALDLIELASNGLIDQLLSGAQLSSAAAPKAL